MVTTSESHSGGSSRPAIEPGKPFPWVKGWAAVGLAFLLVEFWALTRWVTSEHFEPTPTGSDPVPGYMRLIIHSAEVISAVAFLVFLWLVLVRPWRRSGTITLDGLFCLAFCTLFWQDTFSNFFQSWFAYNAEFTNFGVWNADVPGWLSPNGNLIAAPIFLNLAYVWGLFGAVILGCAVMRRVKARWPRLGTTGMIAVSFLIFLVIEGLAEPGMLISGIATYPGGISWLTLFHGHYYQFPLNQWIFFSAVWAGWACLRYFRDDKGHTIAERGIDEVRVSGARRTGLRLLALIGACNTIMVLCYSLPNAVFGLYASPWPDDVTSRSYFSYLCGPETRFACPGPQIPIPRPDSDHVGPDGRLVRK